MIISNFVSGVINDKLDEELKRKPQFKKQRSKFYNELINFYDEHGIIPNFVIDIWGIPLQIWNNDSSHIKSIF